MIFKNQLDINTKVIAKETGVSHLLVRALLWEHDKEFEHIGFKFNSVPTINDQCKADYMYILTPSQALKLIKLLRSYMISKIMPARFIKKTQKIINELTFKKPWRKPRRVIVMKKKPITINF